MPGTKRSAEPNFDRIARVYRWAEYLSLGPLLQRTRTAHLASLAKCRQALLFGDGDGRFLVRLLERNRSLNALAVDTSSKMLRLLQLRCDRLDCAANRVSVLRCSASEAPVAVETDLVVTHFFLDGLSQSEVDGLVERVATAVRPGTLWLVSDFAVPCTPVLRQAARLYIRSLYLAFRLLTGLRARSLPDPQSVLASHGFQRIRSYERLFGLLYSELWVLRPADERHNPAVPGLIHTCMVPPVEERSDAAGPRHFPADALPDPEPSVPSLAEPDPGVFQHEPGSSWLDKKD